MQDEANFIATKVFPNIPVVHRSDRYWTYDRTYWFRDEVQERAPATESAGAGWTVDSTPTYYAPIYALHKDIDDPARANADASFNLDRDATEYLSRQMLLHREKLWVQKYFGTGLWTKLYTGVAGVPGANQVKQWDLAGSTPLEDIDAAMTNMVEFTGYRPNRLVLGPRVYNALRNHAEIIDRIKYTQRGIVTAELLASMFGIDQVLVPFATNYTGKEGQASDATKYSLLYGKSALLCYAAPSPSLLAPSAGYTFSWSGFLGAGAEGNRMKSFRMENLESDRIESEMAFDQKVISADLGAFYTTVIS